MYTIMKMILCFLNKIIKTNYLYQGQIIVTFERKCMCQKQMLLYQNDKKKKSFNWFEIKYKPITLYKIINIILFEINTKINCVLKIFLINQRKIQLQYI